MPGFQSERVFIIGWLPVDSPANVPSSRYGLKKINNKLKLQKIEGSVNRVPSVLNYVINFQLVIVFSKFWIFFQNYNMDVDSAEYYCKYSL